MSCRSCREGLRADLLYMDLGVSSLQVDARGRGFSYSYDAPLDMRMDPAQELDARVILNDWPEERLAAIFSEYGEERYSRQIARELVRRRERERVRHDHRARRRDQAAVPAPAQFGARPSGAARVPGDPDRGQRRAQLARPRPSGGLEAAAPGRAHGRDLVPLARGPAGQAVPGRARARLHLPARPAGLRLRPRAAGRADHTPGRQADRGRARAQSARPFGKAARGPEARATTNGRFVPSRPARPRRHHRRPHAGRQAPPARDGRRAAASRTHRRVPGPRAPGARAETAATAAARSRRVAAARRSFAAARAGHDRLACRARGTFAARLPVARPPAARAGLDRAARRAADRARGPERLAA